MRTDLIRASLKLHEGCRLTAYLDTVGVPTIGYGHTKGVRLGDEITQAEADAFLDEDLRVAIGDLCGRFPWVTALPEPAQEALVEMSFQLGIGRLAKFQRMLEAVRKRRWAEACAEAMDSRWAAQTPKRALHAMRCFAQADADLR